MPILPQLRPYLEDSLRASLETDVTHRFPIHVVTAWLGKSAKIATDYRLRPPMLNGDSSSLSGDTPGLGCLVKLCDSSGLTSIGNEIA